MIYDEDDDGGKMKSGTTNDDTNTVLEGTDTHLLLLSLSQHLMISKDFALTFYDSNMHVAARCSCIQYHHRFNFTSPSLQLHLTTTSPPPHQHAPAEPHKLTKAQHTQPTTLKTSPSLYRFPPTSFMAYNLSCS